MTKDQILLRRWEAINEDTSLSFKKGDLFIFDEQFGKMTKRLTNGIADGLFLMYKTLENNPHLFRELTWWEFRKIEEMPKYVKIVQYHHSYSDINIGCIREVNEWVIIKNGASWSCDSFPVYLSINHIVPSTLEEYIQSLKK